MPQVVDIPGVGEVEFPESMDAVAVNAAAAKLYKGATVTPSAIAPATTTATTQPEAGPDGLSRNLTPEQREMMAQPGMGGMPAERFLTPTQPEQQAAVFLPGLAERNEAAVETNFDPIKSLSTPLVALSPFSQGEQLIHMGRPTAPDMHLSYTTPEGDAWRAARAAGKPLPLTTQDEILQTTGGVVKGVENVATGAMQFLTSPLGIATLGLGLVPGVVRGLASAGFAADMASHAPDSYQKYLEAQYKGDKPAMAEALTEGLGTLAMAGLAGSHAYAQARMQIKGVPAAETAPLKVAADKAEAAGAPATAEALKEQASVTPRIPEPDVKAEAAPVIQKQLSELSEQEWQDTRHVLRRTLEDSRDPDVRKYLESELAKFSRTHSEQVAYEKPQIKSVATDTGTQQAKAGSEAGARELIPEGAKQVREAEPQGKAPGGREELPDVPQAVIEAGQKPTPEIARANRDFNILNRANSGQWSFYFGRLGKAAKGAWERMALGEFRMREATQRDVKMVVEDTLQALPKDMRKEGGKAFFDVVNGKPIETIRTEMAGKPNGEAVIAQAEKVKGRLENIRTTIRDIKRDSYEQYLNGLDDATLADLYGRNVSNGSASLKPKMAEELARTEFPDDWGIADGTYLPHLFFGQWKVTAEVPGREGASFVTRAKTPAEAKARIYDLVKRNPEYAGAEFKVEQDMVIPAEIIRLGDRKFWNMIGRMKEQEAMEGVNVREAVSGIIGRKAAKQKWFGSLQERKGAEGYSKDYEQVMTAYLSGFNRWKELTAMNREVQPMIEQVRREGRLNAEARLNDIMENLWGKPSRLTMEFDSLIRDIPVAREFIKPLALDRWARFVNSVVSNLTLQTVRFGVVNRLQPLQGLYPLIGERLMVEAKILQHSKRGRELLDEAGVDLDAGQYAGETSTRSKLVKLKEKLTGEKSNQELAFLGMYLHGTKRGMSHAEAVNYAKLRGQLMTQFTPLVADMSPLLEGPVGKVIFQYKRFPIKQVELLARIGMEKNVPALARWLAVMGATGGLAYFMRQLYTDPEKKLRAKRALDEQFGEKGGDAVFYGLPGLVGADISGSMILGDEPFGANPYEKVGRQLVGPGPSLTYETLKAALTDKREQDGGSKALATLRKIPALRPIAEVAALVNGDVDITTPDGETKYRRKITDALLGLGSFRSANEANIQLAVSGIMELKKEIQGIKNRVYAEQGSDASIKAVDDFNNRWPEMAITGKELRDYMENRKGQSGKTDAERAAGKKGAGLLP